VDTLQREPLPTCASSRHHGACFRNRERARIGLDHRL